MKNRDTNKAFEKPELEIVLFERDLSTGIIEASGDFEDPDPDPGDVFPK